MAKYNPHHPDGAGPGVPNPHRYYSTETTNPPLNLTSLIHDSSSKGRIPVKVLACLLDGSQTRPDPIPLPMQSALFLIPGILATYSRPFSQRGRVPQPFSMINQDPQAPSRSIGDVRALHHLLATDQLAPCRFFAFPSQTNLPWHVKRGLVGCRCAWWLSINGEAFTIPLLRASELRQLACIPFANHCA